MTIGLTYYGQSCFLLEAGTKTILFDPFITGNDLAKHIDVSAIRPDIICLSHGHSDHVGDAETIARQSDAMLIANFEVGNWFGEKGVKNVNAVNHGGSVYLDGLRIKYVNAIHTSSMPDGSYGGQPGGYVVTWDNRAAYHSGDTALHYDMKLIGESVNLDFAMLCIGDHYTMGIDDAIKAAHFTGAPKVVGMHYDTFDAIKIDHDAAQEAFEKAGLDLILPKIGEHLDI